MTDHFTRLGLPRRFAVDGETIEREYLARSRDVHPDFHAGSDERRQQASLELTAALNEAYVTLTDPYRRAEYLLGLLGGPTARDEKNLDQAFLFEMMELRERIESAKAGERGLDDIEAELNGLLDQRMAQVAGYFADVESAAVPPDGHLSAIRRELNAVKTIRSLLRDLPN